MAQGLCFMAQGLAGAHGLDAANAMPLIASENAQDATNVLNRLNGFIFDLLEKV
jgi:hypothetical protein